MAYSPIVDDPVSPAVATVLDRLRESSVMTIRLHERRRPEMAVLIVFLVDGQHDRSAVLVFDTDHWAAGPNIPGAYFDYLGDRWTPPEQLVRSVLSILATAGSTP